MRGNVRFYPCIARNESEVTSIEKDEFEATEIEKDVAKVVEY